MKLRIVYIGFVVAISTPLAFAGGSHGSGGFTKPKERRSSILSDKREVLRTSEEKEINGELIQRKIVDGYDVKVKVADSKNGVFDGGSHNLLVNIKRNDRVQSDLSVIARVAYPNDEVTSKTMMALGDWYLAGYDLEQAGKYEVQVVFRSRDGKSHSIDIQYP